METAETPTFVPTSTVPEEIKIDLACGQHPRDGFEGADLYAPNAKFKMDILKFPWPWADDSVTAFHCSHFIEHIPNRNVEERDLLTDVTLRSVPIADEPEVEGVSVIKPQHAKLVQAQAASAYAFLGQDMLLAFFDEMYRCLNKEGAATVIWPACTSVRAFQDPTHRRYIPREMLYYLSAEGRKGMAVDHYPVKCNFAFNVTHTMPTEEGLRHAEVQTRRFNECWNVIFDFHATLKPIK